MEQSQRRSRKPEMRCWVLMGLALRGLAGAPAATPGSQLHVLFTTASERRAGLLRASLNRSGFETPAVRVSYFRAPWGGGCRAEVAVAMKTAGTRISEVKWNR